MKIKATFTESNERYLTKDELNLGVLYRSNRARYSNVVYLLVDGDPFHDATNSLVGFSVEVGHPLTVTRETGREFYPLGPEETLVLSNR